MLGPFTAAPHHDILVLLVQVALLLFTARAFGEIAGRLGQPSVVGEILAGGRDSRELETEIEAHLKDEGYLVNPQVGVEILNYRPFYIIGEVNNPGSYQYVSGMTVINAVALAGGFTYRADQDDIIINRGGSQGPKVEALLDTEVLPGDIINVTERFF